MLPFESVNVHAYTLMLRLEVALRELIRSHMESTLGLRWRRRLPGILLAKIREAERDEEVQRHLSFAKLGPLYYLTLGELTEILFRAETRGLQERLGGTTFLEQLRNLLPVRNAVSHGRPVSPVGFACVKALYDQLIAAVGGADTFNELVAAPDVGLRSDIGLQRALRLA